MHAVGGCGVLVDHFVVDATQQHAAIQESSRPLQVFTDLNTGNSRGNRIVIRSGNLLAVTLPLGIPGVDVARAAAQPQQDAVLGSPDWATVPGVPVCRFGCRGLNRRQHGGAGQLQEMASGIASE